MLDIKIIREKPEEVKKRLLDKEADFSSDIDRILELDTQRREIIAKNENLKAEQNRVSKEIPAMKKRGEDTSSLLAEMKTLSDTIKSSDNELRAVEDEYNVLMLGLYNLPDEDLKSGGKEHNEPLRYYGEKVDFGFEALNHVDLCTNLGLIDYPRGAKLSGNGFWIYRGMGAKLEWALLNYFIESHSAAGYELILPPLMLGYDAGLTSGQFPKFNQDVFWIDEGEGQARKFMLPTAETALVTLHKDEILNESELPRKYIAYTPCFRREAGSYRTDERGMVRGHQFNKVEMVQYTRPEDSDAAFDELVTRAETLVRELGFHFRTVKLAAADCSAAMARTYDLEVYMPSIGGYKEISSVSNARDYQARRGMIRFRRGDSGKIDYVHTLNGSGLATSRILPAIVEQNQQKDGSVVVPEVLRKYLGGIEVIS